MTTQLVWFKRDLRAHDNAALMNAARLGPVLCLYIIEPSYWCNPDSSQRQFSFLRECLRDLYLQLQALNGRYVIQAIRNVLELNAVMELTCLAIAGAG